MKKRVLALLLTMSLAGSSLLPVSAMEAGTGSFDDNPGQEQQIGEEGEQPAETIGETEEKMEGNAPGSENDENTLTQGSDESRGEKAERVYDFPPGFGKSRETRICAGRRA